MRHDRLHSASPSGALRPATAIAVSAGWGLAVGGVFGALLPCLLGDWHLHQPLPHWIVARVLGAVLVAAGILAIVASFRAFTSAHGTPVPVASPPRLVAHGPYRHVRNPIYVGFLTVLLGETLIAGSPGLLGYTAIALCIGLAAVRYYEEPVLARRFGAEYETYRRAVPAWIPRIHPWTPGASPRKP